MGIKKQLAESEVAKSELEYELFEIINKKVLEFQKKHKTVLDDITVYCGSLGTIDLGNVLVIDKVDISFDKANWLLMNLDEPRELSTIKSIGQKVTMSSVSLQAQFFYFDKGFAACSMSTKKWFNCGVWK